MRYGSFDRASLVRNRDEQLKLMEKRKKGLDNIANTHKSNSVALRSKKMKITLPKIGA
jgi:hypothetical protein